MRYVGLIVLGIMLFVCLAPFFGVVTFMLTIRLAVVAHYFGAPTEYLSYISLTISYLLSAVAAVLVVRPMWKPKSKQ